MKKLLLLLWIINLNTLLAQEDFNFPNITAQDIPGGVITRASYFGGDALWGLINGGADIFLEYGFDKLLLQEVEWRGLKFRVEFYRMNDAKAAFGIFSVSRYKCNASDTLTKFICITPYQVQAAVGRFYISIAKERGNKEAQDLTTDLFKIILAKINEEAFPLPALFINKMFDGYKNQMKFMNGKLGLQNGFPVWIDMFENFSGYQIYLLPIEAEKNYAYISKIIFETETEAQKFINSQQTDKKKIVKPISAKEILFVESNFPANETDKIISLIDNK